MTSGEHQEMMNNRDAITNDDRERLQEARCALIGTGYFEADEVGFDVAPRITEMHYGLSQRIAELEAIKTPTMDPTADNTHQCASAWHSVWEALVSAGILSYWDGTFGNGRDRAVSFVRHLAANQKGK